MLYRICSKDDLSKDDLSKDDLSKDDLSKDGLYGIIDTTKPSKMFPKCFQNVSKVLPRL